MYYLSLIIASLAGVLYHVSQKSIHPKANPAVSMMITFSVALVGTIIWYLIDGSNNTWITDVKNTNWASFSLGLSLVGLEFGILLAYRSGWQISNFNLFFTFILAALLLPIGIMFFKETISMKTAIGMVVTIGGIVLMKI